MQWIIQVIHFERLMRDEWITSEHDPRDLNER